MSGGLHKHTKNWNRWGTLPVHPRGVYLIGMPHPSSHRNSLLSVAACNKVLCARIEDLTKAFLVTPCRLVNNCRCFEDRSTFETSITSDQSTRFKIPDDLRFKVLNLYRPRPQIFVTEYKKANKVKVQGSVYRKCILIYIQQDATLHSLCISGKCSTCFGW